MLEAFSNGRARCSSASTVKLGSDKPTPVNSDLQSRKGQFFGNGVALPGVCSSCWKRDSGSTSATWLRNVVTMFSLLQTEGYKCASEETSFSKERSEPINTTLVRALPGFRRLHIVLGLHQQLQTASQFRDHHDCSSHKWAAVVTEASNASDACKGSSLRAGMSQGSSQP